MSNLAIFKFTFLLINTIFNSIKTIKAWNTSFQGLIQIGAI